MENNDNKYDVIILGAGHAGTMLATILASNHLNVLLIDKGEHPRFAIGESTIPRTSLMTKIMAARYNTPELDRHAFFDGQRTTNGIKRHFGFVYHRPEEPQRPEEVFQSVIPEAAFGPESHLFRQDSDADMLFCAIRKGAKVMQRTSVTAIETGDDGVRIELDGDREAHADFIVDGTGHQSILARQHDLRAAPETLHTHTRTLFTHMIGVEPYENIDTDRLQHTSVPRPWSQGTLHHIFDGGWLWVIPFNTHEGSTNPLCSVGLTFDSRRYPKTGQTPEQEFHDFLARHPDIARQFSNARKVREWVGTGRLQYASRSSIGKRFCLLSHSAGFIDALFSRGLANTAVVVNLLTNQLIQARTSGDYDVSRFDLIDRTQRALVAENDRLVNCSLISWRHYPLWDAWIRIWVLGSFLDALRLQRLYQRYLKNQDVGVFEALDAPAFPGNLCPGLKDFDSLFNRVCERVEAVEDGADPQEAATAITGLLKNSALNPPVLGLDQANRRHDPILSYQDLLALHAWIKKDAPAELRAWYGNGDVEH